MDTSAKKKFADALGQRVKSARESKNVSQEELAYRCDIDRSYIGKIENGHYSPSAYLIWLIAKKLSVSLPVLLPDLKKKF